MTNNGNISTYTIALDYLHFKGVQAEKAGSMIVAWGCVKILMRYSSERQYNHYYRWSLPETEADVVLLITGSDEPSFYFFNYSDPVFLYADGRRKSGLTYLDERRVQKKHQDRFESLTWFEMEKAKDNFSLIQKYLFRKLAASSQGELLLDKNIDQDAPAGFDDESRYEKNAGCDLTEQETITTNIRSCARCNGDHTSLVFHRFTQPVYHSDQFLYSHWATCPTNGEPILMRITDDPFPKDKLES